MVDVLCETGVITLASMLASDLSCGSTECSSAGTEPNPTERKPRFVTSSSIKVRCVAGCLKAFCSSRK